MLGDWHLKTRAPGNSLSLTISVKHPVLGNYFTTSLTAKKLLITSNVDYEFFFWLMPHKGAIQTYLQVSRSYIFTYISLHIINFSSEQECLT